MIKESKNKIFDKYLQKSSEEFSADETLSNEIRERIAIINALMVQIFLDPKDIGTHNLLACIRFLVKKFRLDGELCEFDILIEAYTIAIKKTREGYVIKNIPAWFKSTAFNIINNLKRESKKQDLIKAELKNEQSNIQTLETINTSSYQIEDLIKAIATLGEEDRYLLNLRIVKGLTWSDIAERMTFEGKENTPSVELLARLRKRHQRALERLRAHYKQVSEA